MVVDRDRGGGAHPAGSSGRWGPSGDEARVSLVSPLFVSPLPFPIVSPSTPNHRALGRREGEERGLGFRAPSRNESEPDRGVRGVTGGPALPGKARSPFSDRGVVGSHGSGHSEGGEFGSFRLQLGLFREAGRLGFGSRRIRVLVVGACSSWTIWAVVVVVAVSCLGVVFDALGFWGSGRGNSERIQILAPYGSLMCYSSVSRKIVLRSSHWFGPFAYFRLGFG